MTDLLLMVFVVVGAVVLALGVDVAVLMLCVKVFCRRRCDPAGLVDSEWRE
jgi:hypothetical protein